ncbi:hypothetical protein [Marinivivus vitaminiproducens]|uniref:hypothetical protein n=1 Tax=Marinivivus vitaminiproducens TaxID=3035935 RepID=UPI00279D544F|nr:hypothetical protein P4R82_09985 [Geminicoccaceae bacterium SCSIO 64248]
MTSTEEAAPALIPLVAGFGSELIVNMGAQWLNEYTDGLSGQFLATGTTERAAFGTESCLIVTRGLKGRARQDYMPTSGMLPGATLSLLGLADAPAFYLESKVTINTDTIVVTPMYINYAASSAKSFGSGRKQVTVVTIMTTTSVLAEDDVTADSSFAIFRHNLGQLEVGRSYDSNMVPGLLTGTAATFKRPAEFEQDGFNIATIVTESEDPSVALTALMTTYDANKSDLSKFIEDWIKSQYEEPDGNVS